MPGSIPTLVWVWQRWEKSGLRKLQRIFGTDAKEQFCKNTPTNWHAFIHLLSSPSPQTLKKYKTQLYPHFPIYTVFVYFLVHFFFLNLRHWDVFLLQKKTDCLQLQLVVKGTNYKGLIANRKVLTVFLVIQEDFFPIFFCFTPRNCEEIRERERTCSLPRQGLTYHMTWHQIYCVTSERPFVRLFCPETQPTLYRIRPLPSMWHYWNKC